MSDDRVNDVIAAIDGALTDWSVSPDAMRWTAPGPPPPSRPVAYFEWQANVLATQLGMLGIAAGQAASALEALLVTYNEDEQYISDDLWDRAQQDDGPPVDPRARALELRRNRSTGPKFDVVHQRRVR